MRLCADTIPFRRFRRWSEVHSRETPVFYIFLSVETVFSVWTQVPSTGSVNYVSCVCPATSWPPSRSHRSQHCSVWPVSTSPTTSSTNFTRVPSSDSADSFGLSSRPILSTSSTRRPSPDWPDYRVSISTEIRCVRSTTEVLVNWNGCVTYHSTSPETLRSDSRLSAVSGHSSISRSVRLAAVYFRLDSSLRFAVWGIHLFTTNSTIFSMK